MSQGILTAGALKAMRTLRMGAIVLLAGAIAGCLGSLTGGSAPVIDITSPVDTEVRGLVSFAATVIAETGVAKVTFIVDGAVLFVDVSEPYQTPWNTTLGEDGDHLLQVLAEDISGNSAGVEKNVTVSNAKN